MLTPNSQEQVNKIYQVIKKINNITYNSTDTSEKRNHIIHEEIYSVLFLSYHFPYLLVAEQRFEHPSHSPKSPFQSFLQMLLSVPKVVSTLYKEGVEEILLHEAASISWYGKSPGVVALVKMLSSEISNVMVDLIETSFCWIWHREDLLYAVPVSHEACKAPFSDDMIIQEIKSQVWNGKRQVISSILKIRCNQSLIISTSIIVHQRYSLSIDIENIRRMKQRNV